MSESLREQIAQAALEWRYIGLSWANARQADREHFTELADAVLPVVEAEIEKVCEREQNTEGTLRARLAEVRRERDDLEVSLATVAAGFEQARARVATLEAVLREAIDAWDSGGIESLAEAIDRASAILDVAMSLSNAHPAPASDQPPVPERTTGEPCPYLLHYRDGVPLPSDWNGCGGCTDEPFCVTDPTPEIEPLDPLGGWHGYEVES